MYEDYEYYSVDPYNPLDPERETYNRQLAWQESNPEAIAMEDRIAKFFRPHFHIAHMPARIFGDALMTQCKSPEDLRNTLLRNPYLK